MTESDLDLNVRRWLAGDAASFVVPAELRGRVMDIPAVQQPGAAWWHRFASMPVVTGTLAAGTVVALVLSGTLFTVFDRPPGSDGGPCNNRQLQRALDDLRDTAGYRYLDTEQRQVLASDPETALQDPEFDWADSSRSLVMYRAPDHTHEVVTPIEPLGGGYLEQVRIGDEQWQLRDVDGTPTWIRIEAWPFGNWAYGYVQNALGILGLPGIASLRFGGAEVPDALTGTDGCTIATEGEVPNRVVALRIIDGRVTNIYLGPPSSAPGNRDAARNLIDIDYTVPDLGEFVAPTDFVDEGVLYPEVSYSAAPVATLSPGEDAWAPAELPVGDRSITSVFIAGVAEAKGTYVAVGSGSGADSRVRSLVWTSPDGVTWQRTDGPTGFQGLSLDSLASDGATFLTIGYRAQDPTEDGTSVPDGPESWLSRDGAAWVHGGFFDSGANPSAPVATDDGGWVAGGSLWNGTVQRPAFFISADARTWTTVVPPGAAYGSVSSPRIEPDGTLRAESCETPEETNVAPGSGCLWREWTSEDGTAWIPGPAAETAPVSGIDLADGRQLAIIGDGTDGRPQLARSDTGATWEPVDLAGDEVAAVRLVEAQGAVLVIAQRINGQYPVASLWRSTDQGETWEELPLGIVPGAIGTFAEHVVWGEHGLTVIGTIHTGEFSAVPVAWIEP